MQRAEKPGFWQALATRERIGWIVYDWANSAFVLCVITVIGSAYFVGVFESAARRAGELAVGPAPALRVLGVAVTGEAAWSLVVGLSAAIVAFSSPFLGAIADGGGHKKRFLQVYCTVGVLATAAIWLGLPWWAVGLLILVGNVGFEGGNVYYNAFLPEIAGAREQDQVSAAGYAFGYIGGVLVLIAALFLIVLPGRDVHTAFLMVAVWWGAFALVTFATLKERPPLRRPPAGAGWVGDAWRQLRESARYVGRNPHALLFLGAFLFYNDGIATLISNATPFAMQNVYVDATLSEKVTLKQLIPAIILVQVVGFPGSIFCGWLATRIGEKRTLYLTLLVYLAVVSYGQVITVMNEFYVMAAAIGMVQGGAQAISRSLFASFVPAGRSAEFFALSSKFSAMIGPLVYGGLLLLTGETRMALLSLSVFFVVGGVLLSFVNIERGRADALRVG
jgi:UMF1 family MFS transporter